MKFQTPVKGIHRIHEIGRILIKIGLAISSIFASSDMIRKKKDQKAENQNMITQIFMNGNETSYSSSSSSLMNFVLRK